MIEITWRFDPRKPVDERVPSTPDEAADRLRAGNRDFAGLTSSVEGDSRHVLPVSADDLGLGAVPGVPPTQAPFAAILGCADSRVPLELVFLQSRTRSSRSAWPATSWAPSASAASTTR